MSSPRNSLVHWADQREPSGLRAPVLAVKRGFRWFVGFGVLLVLASCFPSHPEIPYRLTLVKNQGEPGVALVGCDRDGPDVTVSGPVSLSEASWEDYLEGNLNRIATVEAGEGVVWLPLDLEAIDDAPDHMVVLDFRLDRDGSPSFDFGANSSRESVMVADVEGVEEVGDDPTFCRWTRT